ncbi:hypothetical protein M0D69_24430 [Caballeronia sp. SEWSISQ10-4 2]|nr:hypothetical protein [Caballeronia sp. SEWSISQ10-4 2]
MNVGQLTPLVSALGGTASLNADGSISAPSYKIGTTTTVRSCSPQTRTSPHSRLSPTTSTMVAASSTSIPSPPSSIRRQRAQTRSPSVARRLHPPITRSHWVPIR